MNQSRLIAVLNLPNDAPGTLTRGDVMVECIATNSLFASSNPTAAAFKADLDALRAKQAAKGNGPAAIQARNAALKVVRRDAENFRIFTQQLADANPDKAAEIITAAGMFIKKVPVRNKPDFEIRQGPTSGSANAIAKSRGRGATYWWEVSTNQKDWVGSAPTRKAKTTFANLTPGTTYYFRFQTLTKAGLSDWSQIISFIVK